MQPLCLEVEVPAHLWPPGQPAARADLTAQQVGLGSLDQHRAGVRLGACAAGAQGQAIDPPAAHDEANPSQVEIHLIRAAGVEVHAARQLVEASAPQANPSRRQRRSQRRQGV